METYKIIAIGLCKEMIIFSVPEVFIGQRFIQVLFPARHVKNCVPEGGASY
jgi:hypothetical protein